MFSRPARSAARALKPSERSQVGVPASGCPASHVYARLGGGGAGRGGCGRGGEGAGGGLGPDPRQSWVSGLTIFVVVALKTKSHEWWLAQ